MQKQQITMLAEVLKTNNLISELIFRTCFDREPGGLVEGYEKQKKED